MSWILTWWYVLKTSFQDVLKTFWRRLQDDLPRRLEDVFKATCQDVLNMSSRRLVKASWTCLQDVLKTFLQHVLKTSWRRLEDVSPIRIYSSWSSRFENVLKTSSEDAWVRWIYSSWSKRTPKKPTHIRVNNLTYYFNGKSAPKIIIGFKVPLDFYKYESREKVIKLFHDYSRIVSEAKYKTKYGERLKILTPKQMLQRLPIAVAQVKADNTSENLLNEIRQITYSLYRAKEITKKVCNNIMNSIKL